MYHGPGAVDTCTHWVWEIAQSRCRWWREVPRWRILFLGVWGRGQGAMHVGVVGVGHVAQQCQGREFDATRARGRCCTCSSAAPRFSASIAAASAALLSPRLIALSTAAVSSLIFISMRDSTVASSFRTAYISGLSFGRMGTRH